MNKLHIFSILFCLSAVFCFAQAPDTLWTRTFGGNGSDVAYSMQQTSDGGFIIAGRTNSYGAGGYDVYLIKTDADGDTIWTRTYGGQDHDEGYSVQQTSDGGYIVIGYTCSYSAGISDVYLVKTDANGDSLWTRTYGGSDCEYCYSVQQTSDEGYIIAGSTASYITVPSVIEDFYLVKTDSNGDTLWTRTYGRSQATININYATSVHQMSDGGYFIAGISALVNLGNINYDIYSVRTDTNGDTLWTRAYDEDDVDMGWDSRQTIDGGYIICGRTKSYTTGRNDVYAVRTDANGDTVWTRTYGGAGADIAKSVDVCADGGFILAGSTVSPGLNQKDVYFIKTDTDGNTLWTLALEGVDNEGANCVEQTVDSGFIAAGYTASFGAGGNDVWLIRLSAQTSFLYITLTPYNPPIILPAGGGIFSYDAVIENLGVNPVNFEAWTEVVLPNGNVHGPLLHRNNLNIPPGAVISRELSQMVPGYAPSGNYTYIGNIGFYPDSVLNTDNFPFEKRAGYDGASYIQSWEIFGWDDEEAVSSRQSAVGMFAASPNPFNAETDLSFKLHTAGNVKLAIYDISGREAARLAEGYHPAGTYQVEWDASAMPSGVYFARLKAGEFTGTRKMLLVK